MHVPFSPLWGLGFWEVSLHRKMLENTGVLRTAVRKKRPSYRDPGRKNLLWEVSRTTNQQAPSLPYLDTLPGLLLTLTALRGKLPIILLLHLPYTDSYKESVNQWLKRERLLRTYYHDGLRGLRLTSTCK